MEIIDKKLQPSLKEALIDLPVSDQCISENAYKKQSVRNTIQRLKASHPQFKFKTMTENRKIFIWKTQG